MNDERFLKDWLHDTTTPSTRPNAAADKVVARIPATPQRRRWLPWPPARRTKPEEPDWRTRIMLSPTKAIIAGALMFSVGAAFLVAQPIDQPTATGPGAASEAVTAQAPAPFSGEIHAWGPIADGGWQWTPQEMTDPRLDGKAYYSGSEMSPTDDTWVGWWTLRIENDDGAWQTSFPGYSWGIAGPDDDGLGPHVFTALLYGEDAYEGLVAVMVIDIYGNPEGWTVNGVILDEDALMDPPAAARAYVRE